MTMRAGVVLILLTIFAIGGCAGEQHTGQASPHRADQPKVRTYRAPNGLFTARIEPGNEAVSGGRDRWWHVMTLSDNESPFAFIDRMQYVFGSAMTAEERGMLIDDGSEEFILYMWVELIQPYLAEFGPNAETLYEHLEPRGDTEGVMAVMRLPEAAKTMNAQPGQPVETFDQIAGYYVWQENGVVMMASVGHYYRPGQVDQTQAVQYIVGETRRLAQQVTVPPVETRQLPSVGR